MGRSLNKVTLIGNLGRDPELRNLQSGSQVCNFSVATTEKWNDKATGEKREATEWHRISTFGKLAGVCAQYLSKGSLVFVEGKIKSNNYEKDGVTHYGYNITANEIKFLDSRATVSRDEGYYQGTYAVPDQVTSSYEDDIPF